MQELKPVVPIAQNRTNTFTKIKAHQEQTILKISLKNFQKLIQILFLIQKTLYICLNRD